MPNVAVSTIKPQALTLKLRSRVNETNNIVSFEWDVSTESGDVFYHYPGQAVTLTIPYEGKDHIRTFTIASPPSQNNLIVLTIKAGEGAKTTRHMHESWVEGTTVEARGPFGNFSLVHTPNTPLLLIGAGSGITPMLSMMKWLFDRNELQTDVVLLQQASTPADLLKQDQLSVMDAAMRNMTHISCVSSVPKGQAWSGFRGRLSRGNIGAMVPDLARRSVFCCGPEGFSELVKKIYLAEGGLLENFHTESFGAKDELVVKSKNVDKVLDSSALTINLDGHIFNSSAEKTIVDSAADFGIKIPTGCKEGYCGTCKLKLSSGTVSMQHSGGISKTEEEDGFILACSSIATSNITVTRKY